jgi:hypothetical protein
MKLYALLMAVGAVGCMAAGATLTGEENTGAAGDEAPSATAIQSESLPLEVQDALKWYDSVGFPSVKGLTRVKVITHWEGSPSNRSFDYSKNAWLLEEKPGGWRLFAYANMGDPVAPGGLRPWEERMVMEHGKGVDERRYRTEVRKTDFKARESRQYKKVGIDSREIASDDQGGSRTCRQRKTV